MVQRANRFMIGWQEWHYCGCDDPTTSGPGDRQANVIDPRKAPRGENLDAAKLAILSEPHALAVAGTPTAMSFDAGRHVYSLAWKTARATGRGGFAKGAITEVVVPRRQYPKGYRATVRGGRVVSKRDALRLRLRIRAGAARTLQLTVAPRS